MQVATTTASRIRIATPTIKARVDGLRASRFAAVATLVLATIVAVLPSWKQVWYQDDQLPTVFRTLHTDLAHLHGSVLPRVAFELGFGYGQLLDQVYPPLGFELTAWLHALGLGYLNSARVFFSICVVLACVGMYVYASSVLRRPWCAVVAAIAYIWAPYLLLDVHPGGDFGESLALALLPCSLAAFQTLDTRGSWGAFGAAALGLAAVALAHNITALMYMGLLIVYVGALATRRLLRSGARAALAPCGRAIAAALLALGLAAFYWVPALVEMPFTRIAEQREGSFSVIQYLIAPASLLQSEFRFKYDLANQGRYGLIELLLTGVALALFAVAAWRPSCVRWRAWRARRGRPDPLIVGGFAIAFGIVLLLQVRSAEPVWRYVPLISFVQFPRRLFVFSTLASAIMIGTLPWSLARLGLAQHLQVAVAGLLLGALGASSLPGVYWSAGIPPSHIITDRDVTIGSAADWRFSQRSAYDDFFPAWVTEAQVEIAQPPHVPEAYRAATDLPAPPLVLQEWSYGRARLTTDADTESAVVLHTFYFPGWRATANGQSVPVEPVGPLGLVRIALPPGHQDIDVWFGDTPVRIIASIVSVVSGLLLLGVLTRAFGIRRTLVGGAVVGIAVVTPWLAHLQTSARPSSPVSQAGQQVTGCARIVGVGLERSSYVAGDTVNATVIWQATEYTAADLESGLRLTRADSDQPLAERWSRPDLGRTPTGKWLLGELVPDRLAVVIPSSTPPGHYRLLAGLGTRTSAALVPVGDIRVQ